MVGTFSAFFDFASGAAGISLGGVAALIELPGRVRRVGGLAAVAIVLLRSGFGRHDDRRGAHGRGGRHRDGRTHVALP